MKKQGNSRTNIHTDSRPDYLVFYFRILLKERDAELEAITHQKDVEQDTTIVSAESGGCGQLRRELDVALVKLNEQSCAKYGDLLRENFTLTHKVERSDH